MRKFLLLTTIVLLAITALSISVTQGTKRAPAPADQGEAAIGGAFTLVDTNGQTVTNAAYHGKLMLVFFGFTHCPDICPVTVKTMSDVITQLGAQSSQVAPIFITVDPERDTPRVLGEFLTNVDPHLIGLTGSLAQVKEAAAAYKVYYAQQAGKTATDDYTMDHSGFIYLMARDGTYITHFSYDTKSDAIVLALKPYLN